MEAKRIVPMALAVAVALAAPARAQNADGRVVLDWNAITVQLSPPPVLVRNLAMVHIAAFDAVNAIAPRYEAYLTLPEVTAPTDGRAAAVGAAYGVLRRLQPGQAPALDVALAASLAAIPAGPARTAGLALGDAAAAAIVALRASDNFLLPNPVYVPGTGPAAYQLTPPAFANPVNQAARLFVPFVMATSDEFQSAGPLALSSPKFRQDYDEVRTIGVACASADACARTPEQTIIALWHTEQAFPQLNRIARALAPDRDFDLLDTARTFALLNMAMADGFISVFEAKYTYNFVRPVTAIRGGDADGVPGTEGDPTWTPLLVTPPHPEYPSAHGVIQAAGVEILKDAFGHRVGFDAISPGVPGLTRHFEDFDAFVADGQAGRIYGGIHFRTAVEDGVKQGRRVGRRVRQALRPLE